MKNEQNPSIKQVKVYSIVTLILIVIGSGVSYWTAGRIEYYTDGVMHTSDVLQRTDELYSSVRGDHLKSYHILDINFFSFSHSGDQIMENGLFIL